MLHSGIGAHERIVLTSMTLDSRTSPQPKTTGPAAVVLSHDGSLLELVLQACVPPWVVEPCFGCRAASQMISERSIQLVVVDDEALAESEQGWFIDHVHRRSPDALIVYLASRHSPELERAIRAHGVLHYTAKPVETERLNRVLRGVAERAASRTVERPRAIARPARARSSQ